MDVYKNPSAEIIEGGLGGTINLRTRMPFDEPGRKIAGSVDANYGDKAKDTRPSASFLFSDRWQTGVGEMGFLANVSYSELATQSDGILIQPYSRRGRTPAEQPEGLPNGEGWVYDWEQEAWVSSDSQRDLLLEGSGRDHVFVPGGVNWRRTDFDRKRQGGAFAFQLSSPDIKPGGPIANEQVFKGFGCNGGNVSPALAWKEAPKGTKSFALLVHDPDAPTGGAGWWHWAVYNLPADAKGLDKGAGTADGAKLPKGAVQPNTDFGAPGWGGPCPPVGHGAHRFVGRARTRDAAARFAGGRARDHAVCRLSFPSGHALRRARQSRGHAGGLRVGDAGRADRPCPCAIRDRARAP